jgi:GDP-4-dehydro-6-deoxy-D-mannose reductase
VAEGRTILLLGASGFVGGHLREAAGAASHDVIGTSRSGERADIACDLLHPSSLRRAVAEAAPDLIVNLAGSPSVAESWRRPAETFEINATGVLNLLAAVVVERPGAYVLCVSSAEVYGEPSAERLPFEENLVPSPVTPYGVSKAAMEVVCEQYARSNGLRIGISRSFNQIGPGQAPEFVASGLARQVAAAEKAGAERVELELGNPGAARDFVDVRDGVRALLTLAERELTGVFNLCSGEAVPVLRLTEHLEAATPLAVEVRRAPALERPLDASVVQGAPGRLREATGWRPEIPLERSLADTLEWWRAHV